MIKSRFFFILFLTIISILSLTFKVSMTGCSCGGGAEDEINPNVEYPFEISEGTGYINGWVVDASTNEPVSGAVVTAKGNAVPIEGYVISDDEGKFAFPVDPQDGYSEFAIKVSMDGYTTAYRSIRVRKQRDATVEEVRLTPIDETVTKVGKDGGTHTSANGELELVFPEGAVSEDIEVRTTKFNAGIDLGGVLPETSFFTYAVEFSPDGTTFGAPVTVRMKNTRGFAAGTKVPLGFFNSETMQWEDKGMGTVDASGEWLELAVDHFSSWDFNFPLKFEGGADDPGSMTDITQGGFGGDAGVCNSSKVSLLSGDLTVDRMLPSYKIFGQDQGVELVYQSGTVSPEIMIAVENGLLEEQVTPERIGFKAIFEGEVQRKVFEGTRERGLYKAIFPAENARGFSLETGLYPYTIEVSHYYEGSYATADCFGCAPKEDLGIKPDELGTLAAKRIGEVPVVNWQNSNFGAGWSVAGFKRLYKEPGGDELLLVDGDGAATVFSPGGVETIAGNGSKGFSGDGGPATEAKISVSQGLALDSAGNLYIMDNANSVVRKIDTNGIITTFAGNGSSGLSGDGGPATSASLNNPQDIFVDKDDVLYILQEGDTLRRVTSDGIISTFDETDTTKEDGIYVSDSLNHVIKKVYPDGRVETVAGTGVQGYSGDGGPALNATLNTPGAFVKRDENIYFLDRGNHMIRKIDSSGIITRFAGRYVTSSGYSGSNGDNGLAIDALIGDAFGFTDDEDGNFYIAEYYNAVLRKINLDGVITTIAGNGELAYNGDGYPMETSIGKIVDMFVKRDGSEIYFSDSYNNRIRKIANKVYLARSKDAGKIFLNENGWRLEYKDESSDYFDADGFLVKRESRIGQATTYEYDESDRLAKIVDPLGGETAFAYNEGGRLAQITDPQGRVTQFTIGETGDLTGITLPDGSLWKYEYDEFHHMTKRIDPRGFETEFIYDKYGKISRVLQPTGEENSYDTGWSVGAIGDLDGGTNDNPAATILSENIVSRYTDGVGRTSTYELTRDGQVVKSVSAAGEETLYERNESGLVVGQKDPLGTVKRFGYDASGNLGVYLPDETQNSLKYEYTYDSKGRIIEMHEPGSRSTTFVYDERGNLIERTDAEGGVTTLEYNNDGLPTKVTNAAGETTTFSYNSQGNLASLTDGLGNVTQFSYDSSGNITSITDGNGKVTSYAYDDLNRLVSATDARGNSVIYSYSQIGCGCNGSYDRITSITDANGNATRFEYDGLGELVRKIDANGYAESYSYDLGRNLVEHIDREGNVVRYGYDTANRLISISGPDGATTFGYDAGGLMLSAANVNQALEFDYAFSPVYNRYMRVYSSVSGVVSDQETSRSFASNSTVVTDRLGPTTISLDKLLASSWMKFPEYSTTTQYTTRDELGRLTDMYIGKYGTYEAKFYYDEAGRLEELFNDGGTGFIDHHHRYTLDGVGDREAETDFYGVHDYDYDPIYQLVRDTFTGESYTYDSMGNRLTDADGKGYSYGAGNRLVSAGGDSYSYDANGNLVSKTVSGVTWDYDWNSQNQLIGATNSAGLSASFKYDPFGRRIEKNINGTIRRYVYEGAHIRFIYDGSNTLLYSLNYGPGIDTILRMKNQQTGVKYIFLRDGRGSVYQVINEDTRAIVNRYEYDDFGNIVDSTEGIENPFTYTSREWEPALGMYYYRARWYDPSIGRFISEDPVGLYGDFNLYRYVENNSINFVDPYGLIESYAFGSDRRSGAYDNMSMEPGSRQEEIFQDALSVGMVGMCVAPAAAHAGVAAVSACITNPALCMEIGNAAASGLVQGLTDTRFPPSGASSYITQVVQNVSRQTGRYISTVLKW